ncbi:hypothetical protein BKA81DRAFT_381405 [Phyllosticta paracitricarpa]
MEDTVPFETTTDPARREFILRFLITFPAIPWWMVVPKSPGALKQPLPVEMAPHNYTLCLDSDETTHTRRLQRHVKYFLEPKGLRLPQSNETVFKYKLRRLFEGEEGPSEGIKSPLTLESRVRVNHFPCRTKYKRRVDSFVDAVWANAGDAPIVDDRVCGGDHGGDGEEDEPE